MIDVRDFLYLYLYSINSYKIKILRNMKIEILLFKNILLLIIVLT